MPKYIPYDYNQNAMVVINYLDQLQPGTFEHAIHYLIDNKLDLSIFHCKYQNEDNGRPAYDPAVLLKIILFAYSKGITSSREIQWCCETNIIFKALSCDTVPHFTTIAAFVSGSSVQIAQLFEQVLLVCHQQGLLGNELFAIDGCKMSSNAAKEWSGTFKELSAKRDKLKRQIRYHLEQHKKLDAQANADDERKARHQQSIETLNKAHDKIEHFLKTASPRMGQGKRCKEVKSNITDNESAKMTTSKGTIQGYNGVAAVDKKHQIIVDAQAFGEGQEHHTLVPVLEKIKQRYKRMGISEDIFAGNTIVTADTGFANEANNRFLYEQHINGYVPDNQFRKRDPKFSEQKQKYGKRHQDKTKGQKPIFPSTAFVFDPIAMTCICPAGNRLTNWGIRTEPNGRQRVLFSGRLLHCRNCDLKEQCMQTPESANHRKGSGRQVSFLLRANASPNYTDWMKQRVDSELGKQIYSHRMSVVEPVFGNIGTNKGLKRFSLRGKTKVQGQWQLFCMVHNLEKVSRYGKVG
ncbi:IS1182 family transposase [Alishewanella tabrizica]|uniref:IS5/IS1182 family transposase n=2 Tax=Alishewanella TaxID=111142 RepID=A0ABQ2WTE3_9ALTE|nr:IS1182 family transposase [Alishewanella tabrizica]GGW73895.1 IS5/IS1182 family transposase [Alishewanella tabrizica]